MIRQYISLEKIMFKDCFGQGFDIIFINTVL